MGWVVNATPRPVYPRERSGAHCKGRWVGPRADVKRCGKSHPHRDSIPGPYMNYVRPTINTALRKMKYLHLQRFGDFKICIQNFDTFCETVEPIDAKNFK
jgi:hypothetical protein